MRLCFLMRSFLCYRQATTHEMTFMQPVCLRTHLIKELLKGIKIKPWEPYLQNGKLPLLFIGESVKINANYLKEVLVRHFSAHVSLLQPHLPAVTMNVALTIDQRWHNFIISKDETAAPLPALRHYRQPGK